LTDYSDVIVSVQRVQVLTPTAKNPNVYRPLRDYADRLRQIQISLAELAKNTDKQKEILSSVAASVGSASTVARHASVTIDSKERHHERVATAKINQPSQTRIT
jgi:hypothetical protein